MKERPILFNTDMVRAILDGRKTQTRRIVKPQPLEGGKVDSTWIRPFAKGQRLWVRESWAWYPLDHDPTCVIYRADYPHGTPCPPEYERWRPCIHMPRWASRILLEVTAVRVERLQDISEADAQAEGATGQCPVGNLRIYNEAPLAYHFAQIWEQAHPNTWDQNPWVWVIDFQRIEP